MSIKQETVEALKRRGVSEKIASDAYDRFADGVAIENKRLGIKQAAQVNRVKASIRQAKANINAD